MKTLKIDGPRNCPFREAKFHHEEVPGWGQRILNIAVVLMTAGIIAAKEMFA